VLLQADVTLNSADDRALLTRFKLFGPPGILFFDPQGREIPDAQVVGFQKAPDFLLSLKKAGL
jgi:thiol:disulfide interchange protein DsbD